MINLKSVGQAECVGGYRPDPPIDGFPLLVCVDGVIRTEDGAIAARVVADEYDAQADETMASRAWAYHTTEAHVRQALAYAIIAGWLDI